tara:strand:+ start:6389 stop:8443 length:2055 start_codon:yes stop_codon:yes gene_type:complete
MENLWDPTKVNGLDELDKLVYMTNLIGADSSLVVWGGGNTSIKTIEKDFMGNEAPAMWIKGSGSDMKSMVRSQFPRLNHENIMPLFERDDMSDEDMVDYLERCLMDAHSPRPSIETLLHAFLPFMSVAHSHADAVVSLTNNDDSVSVLSDVYGDRIAVVDYYRPGFKLSKLVGLAVKNSPHLDGVVLMNHGLFTWGNDTKEAYDKHISLVTKAEEYIAKGRPSVFGLISPRAIEDENRKTLASTLGPYIRGLVSEQQGTVLRYDSSAAVVEFMSSEKGQILSSIGPATPDHLIHTKRRPLWIDPVDIGNIDAIKAAINEAMSQYVKEYTAWYQEHTLQEHPMLDPYPRVILMPGVGMWTTGKDAHAARIVADIYHHTINVIAGAQAVGEYSSLTAQDVYDAEYWPLELYKLTIAPPEKELARKVALVTGAASGIGKTIAERLASEGAHVVVTDLDGSAANAVAADIVATNGFGRAIGVELDVSDPDSVAKAFESTRLEYGGLDLLVSNAGIAPVGAIDKLDLSDWQRSLDINTTGHFLVAAKAVQIMKEQDLGGSIVFIGTKNVPAPGAEFGAYSVSKAAEVQLARVLALETGASGIRVNIVNPDAIFEGSQLWSQSLREERAAAHGVSVDDLETFYHERTLLKRQVRSSDVAETVLFLASERASRTTGAMIPVDGGVKEAFPR